MAREPKDAVGFMLRMKERLRARLEAAARPAGRTITAEIVSRLEASLDEDERAGSRETASFLRLLAAMIDRAERKTGKRWTDDFQTWAAVGAALQFVHHDFNPGYPDKTEAEWEAITAARRDLDQREAAVAGAESPAEAEAEARQLRTALDRLMEIDPFKQADRLGLRLYMDSKGRGDDGEA